MRRNDDWQMAESDHSRFEDVYARHRRFYEEPDGCCPMIIVNTPVQGLPSWEDRLDDPMVMLRAELDGLPPHLEIGDDRAPTVRVQFGTAQVATASCGDINLTGWNRIEDTDGPTR
jgi:hypothetical protein